MHEGCDEQIYDRLNKAERATDRHDERIKHMENAMNEIKPEIKKLQRMTWQSEIRLGFALAGIMFLIHHFVK